MLPIGLLFTTTMTIANTIANAITIMRTLYHDYECDYLEYGVPECYDDYCDYGGDCDCNDYSRYD